MSNDIRSSTLKKLSVWDRGRVRTIMNKLEQLSTCQTNSLTLTHLVFPKENKEESKRLMKELGEIIGELPSFPLASRIENWLTWYLYRKWKYKWRGL